MIETVSKIQELIAQSGKSANAILKELDLSPTALSEWKKGKTKPTVDALTKIANYFSVSVDFLLDRKPKLPKIKLGNEKNDSAPWYSEKLHNTLVSLTSIAEYLLEIKKNSINDNGIKFIQQELSNSLDLVIRLISVTNGVEHYYSGDENYLIIEKGIKGYEDVMKKIGIIPQRLHKMYAQKNHPN